MKPIKIIRKALSIGRQNAGVCFLLNIFLAINSYAATDAQDALALLKKSNPTLYSLYQSYPSYHKQLTVYADMQGYQNSIENLATVVHELIHIDSYIHHGYYIAGAHYDPYLSAVNAWPSVNNKGIEQYLTAYDIAALGPIYSLYMHSAPNNTIANELDEINAYGQTLPFICGNAPKQTGQHLRALAGHLALVDIYLRTLSKSFTAQYRDLTKNRASRGALETIIANAYVTLNECWAANIQEADPRQIPKNYTQAFAATK